MIHDRYLVLERSDSLRYLCLSLLTLMYRYFAARENGLSHEEASAKVAKERGDHRGELKKTTITYVNGSVEAACALGLADGIGTINFSKFFFRYANPFE
jgi:hypothetical protein